MGITLFVCKRILCTWWHSYQITLGYGFFVQLLIASHNLDIWLSFKLDHDFTTIRHLLEFIHPLWKNKCTCRTILLEQLVCKTHQLSETDTYFSRGFDFNPILWSFNVFFYHLWFNFWISAWSQIKLLLVDDCKKLNILVEHYWLVRHKVDVNKVQKHL